MAGKGRLGAYAKFLEASGVAHDLSLAPSADTFRIGDGRALESLGCVEAPLAACGLAFVSKINAEPGNLSLLLGRDFFDGFCPDVSYSRRTTAIGRASL